MLLLINNAGDDSALANDADVDEDDYDNAAAAAADDDVIGVFD